MEEKKDLLPSWKKERLLSRKESPITFYDESRGGGERRRISFLPFKKGGGVTP